MKSDSHIPELKLSQVAAKNTRLDPEEVQHMESCAQCLDRLAQIVRETLQDATGEKTAEGI